MGDIGNLIEFAYRWIRDERWRRYLFLFAGVLLAFGLALLATFAIVFGALISSVISILIESPHFAYFLYQQFVEQFLSALPSFIPIVVILFILAAIVLGWIGFVVMGRALKDRGYAAQFTEFNGKALRAYFGAAVIAFLTTLFNWLSTPILILQIITYVIVIIGFIEPFVWFALIIFAPISFILILYTSIRLQLTLPLRSVERDDAISSVKESWERSKNEFWEIVGIISAAATPAGFVIGYGEPALRPLAISITLAGGVAGAIIAVAIYVVVFVALLAALALAGSFGVAYLYHIIRKTEAKAYAKLAI